MDAEVGLVGLLAVLKLKLNDEKLVPHVAVYIAGRKKSGEGRKVTLSADHTQPTVTGQVRVKQVKTAGKADGECRVTN